MADATSNLRDAARRVVELCPVATDAYTRAQYEEAAGAMEALRAAIEAEDEEADERAELVAQTENLTRRLDEAEQKARAAWAARGRLEAAIVERDAEIDRLQDDAREARAELMTVGQRMAAVAAQLERLRTGAT